MSHKVKLLNDDCLNILKHIPDNSIDSIVTDPPAGISFRGLEWDDDRGGRQHWINWLESVMKECHRTLKPGAHGFVWALPRNSHWTAMAIENAGFRVKDVVTHVFASGFPKNMYLDKMIRTSKRTDPQRINTVTVWMRKRKKRRKLTNAFIDSHVGAKGLAAHWTGKPYNSQAQIPTVEKWPLVKELFGNPPEHIERIVKEHQSRTISEDMKIILGIEADRWKGWGTALKPASEHWILIQKRPIEQGVACNAIKYGTGGLNIGNSRIPTKDEIPSTSDRKLSSSSFFGNQNEVAADVYSYSPDKRGRFPANFLVTLERNLSNLINLSPDTESSPEKYFKSFFEMKKAVYTPKASKVEKGLCNIHPTVKPINLMSYLTKLITPEKGIVLDPFMGSGTTGLAAVRNGFRFIGIEKETKYFKIARRRLYGCKRANL